MSKEKFDRSKPHVNIGDIKTVDHAKSTTEAAFNMHKKVMKSMHKWFYNI